MNINAEPTLVANRIQTPDGTILQSYTRHDFKMHKDANGETYMVDGGLEYMRRSVNVVPAKDMSVWSDDSHEIIREALCWGTRGKDGKQPLRYIPLSSMETEHIEACLETQPHMHPTYRISMKNELAYRQAMVDNQKEEQ